MKKQERSFSEAVIVFTKSSSHSYSLVEPKIVTIESLKFLEGIQVTGKKGHRMERKKTLVPFDHIASIVEFASEDELFSEPQSALIRKNDEDGQNAILTSHEQPQRNRSFGNGNRSHRRERHHAKGNGNSNREHNGFRHNRGFDR